MVERALRKIEADLLRLASDEERPLDHGELRHIAIRIGAQAEMLEIGIAEVRA